MCEDAQLRTQRAELKSLASVNGTATDAETLTQKQRLLLDDYNAYHQRMKKTQFDVAELEGQLAAKRASSSDADNAEVLKLQTALDLKKQQYASLVAAIDKLKAQASTSAARPWTSKWLATTLSNLKKPTQN